MNASNRPKTYASATWTGPLLLVFFAAACAQDKAPEGAAAGAAQKSAPPTLAVRVESATLEKSDKLLSMIRPGEVEGVRQAILAAAAGGLVEWVGVESGERVKKGKVLARVDATIHRAQEKLTKVELDDAQRELARLEDLGKAVAKVRVDAAHTRVARAQAQHQLAAAQSRRAVIRAPFEGVVVDFELEVGEVAPPGAPVARIIQLDKAKVSVSVADRDVSTLKVGDVAKVQASGLGEAVMGTISRIEPAADMQTRTFLVDVEVDNEERRLLPGMMAQVTFKRERNNGGFLIPQDFLVTRKDDNGVYLVDGTKARWQSLHLGRVMGSQVEVLGGLTGGEEIITLGQRGLADGDPVLVMRKGACCENGRIFFHTKDSGTSAQENPGTTDAKEAAAGDGKVETGTKEEAQ